MANITRWNPMRDLMDTSRRLDRFMDTFWRGDETLWPDMNIPALDVVENDKEMVIKAELPGYTPEQVDLRIEGDVLHLKGEANTENTREEGQYHLRERSMHSFQRSIRLPVSVKAEKAEAHFENGILTLTLPKDEAAMPKRIDIKPTKTLEVGKKA